VSRYAENTTVTPEASRGEIEKTLRRYGANAFSYGWEEGDGGAPRAAVSFRADNRQIRFVLEMPSYDDREFTHTPTKGLRRTATQQMAEYDKAVRQRWRALALVIKAKLEAVEADITTFEDEFLAHIVLPSGRTVGDEIRGGIELAYETGTMQPLLPSGN
jgi:hypothetical protein